jgi:hypothetical protein
VPGPRPCAKSPESPDLADLCLIRLSELFPHHTVITVDEEDFRIYRRNNREMIPILCPPRSPASH